MQEQAGVADRLAARAAGFARGISDGAADILGTLPLVFVGARDADGRVWATAATGRPGFAQREAAHRIDLEWTPQTPDPLTRSLVAGADVALLAIRFDQRIRMRVNGRVEGRGAGAADGLGSAGPGANGIRVQADQVFANCPQYITRRRLTWHDASAGSAPGHTSPGRLGRRPPTVTKTHDLDAAARRLVETSDTFVIASGHPVQGTDVSHRGGPPGFVEVVNRATLRFPDYKGNDFFQTLGNVHVDDRVGLLFVDWHRGHLLHVHGRMHVEWEMPIQRADESGRRQTVNVETVVWRPHALAVRGVPVDGLDDARPGR